MNFEAGVGRAAFASGSAPDRPGSARPVDSHRTEFSICAAPDRVNCVVDGDTFWFEGTKIRISDIDAPEVSEPTCVAEAQAGEMATRRLVELFNSGPFTRIAGSRDEDRYGRKLRIVARGGGSLGVVLAHEGLARLWDGPRLSRCS